MSEFVDFSNFGVSTLFFIFGYLLFYTFFKHPKSRFWKEHSEVEKFIFGTMGFVAIYFFFLFFTNLLFRITAFFTFDILSLQSTLYLFQFPLSTFIIPFLFIVFLGYVRRTRFRNISYSELDSRNKDVLAKYCYNCLKYVTIFSIFYLSFVIFGFVDGYKLYINGIVSSGLFSFLIFGILFFVFIYSIFKISKNLDKIIHQKKFELVLLIIISSMISLTFFYFSFPSVRLQNENLIEITFENYIEPNTTIQENIEKSYKFESKLIKWIPLDTQEISYKFIYSFDDKPSCNVSYKQNLKCDIKDNYVILSTNDTFSTFNFSVVGFKQEYISDNLIFTHTTNDDTSIIQVNNTFNSRARAYNLFLDRRGECKIVNQKAICGDSTKEFEESGHSYEVPILIETPDTRYRTECQYAIENVGTKQLHYLIVPQNTNFTLIARIIC